MNLHLIEQQAAQATSELVEQAGLAAGSIFVVGCSSSEVIGEQIGQCSSVEAAQAVYNGIISVLQPKGIYLAAQCCEQPVCVMPQPKAGGSFATIAWQQLEQAVVLEQVQADAGLDIGGTLIGMHLKAVAVPVRLQTKQIGQALLIAARTRPKYIGGPRAGYPDIPM